MNRWKIPETERKELVSLLKFYFNKLEKLKEKEIEEMDNEEFILDLGELGFKPYWVWEILEEEFNYEKIEFDDNGWELDFWIYFDRKDNKIFPSTCEKMVLYGTGMTFELYLSPEEFL